MTASFDPKAGMVLCIGCGFHVEPEGVIEREEYGDRATTCVLCKTEPRLKESYRRGFNAGIDALERAVIGIVQTSSLRKKPP
jgi:hypothetical protein